MTYKIEFGSWPISKLGGLASHNFLVLRDESGSIIAELNGGAAGPDGSFNYTALDGPLTARHTVHADPVDERRLPRFATRRDSTFVELFSGSQQEVLEKWNAGVACVEAIDKKGLTYLAPALNSNSVAGTVAKCMDLKQPFVAPNDFSRPASQRQLLTDGEINTIRSEFNLPPIKGDTNKEAPSDEDPKKQGAIDEIRAAETTGRKLRDRFKTDKATNPAAALTLLEDNMNIEDGAVSARMSAIQGLMGDRSSEYWMRPKADVLQEEYRNLIEMRDRNKAGDGNLPIREAHRTTTWPAVDADTYMNVEDKAVSDR